MGFLMGVLLKGVIDEPNKDKLYCEFRRGDKVFREFIPASRRGRVCQLFIGKKYISSELDIHASCGSLTIKKVNVFQVCIYPRLIFGVFFRRRRYK